MAVALLSPAAAPPVVTGGGGGAGEGVPAIVVGGREATSAAAASAANEGGGKVPLLEEEAVPPTVVAAKGDTTTAMVEEEEEEEEEEGTAHAADGDTVAAAVDENEAAPAAEGDAVVAVPAAEGAAVAAVVADGKGEAPQGVPVTDGEGVNAISAEGDDEGVKWLKHYSSVQSILTVGDGNFSFSLALATAFGSGENVVATSLDSIEHLRDKYSKAESNIMELKRLGVTVLHGIDAKRMKDHTDLKLRRFDRIVFNFPHAGFKGKEDDLRLIKKEDYPGYNQKRGDSAKCDQPFDLGACCTFMFIRDLERLKKVRGNRTRAFSSPVGDIPFHPLVPAYLHPHFPSQASAIHRPVPPGRPHGIAHGPGFPVPPELPRGGMVRDPYFHHQGAIRSVFGMPGPPLNVLPPIDGTPPMIRITRSRFHEPQEQPWHQERYIVDPEVRRDDYYRFAREYPRNLQEYEMQRQVMPGGSSLRYIDFLENRFEESVERQQQLRRMVARYGGY
ncbi:uncharacterized protein LOC102721956 isoform X2 [Oryza brachyantha]|uniref:uncharacterized protein LOC102721956 isoform X2 n=1 Tax=Oryza brachyantha TaxID=4533 RepID=UPI001ADAE9B0|nr:uncharacterized protein LOC102721956 isoform X2 [Oryza brachyantha]